MKSELICWDSSVLIDWITETDKASFVGCRMVYLIDECSAH